MVDHRDVGRHGCHALNYLDASGHEMMTILIIGLLGAFGVTLFIFALSLEREKGVFSERVRKLEEQATIDKKRAEIIAQARTDDETIDRLDRGSF